MELFANQSTFPLLSLHSNQGNYPPVTEPFNFSKIKRIWVQKIFYCWMVRAFYDCCVSACAVIYIECKKNRRQNSALWSASGNRAGRRECLMANSLRTIDKKINNPENQSWVNVKFPEGCHEVWLYKPYHTTTFEGRRKADEENLNEWTWIFKVSIYIICITQKSECCTFSAFVVLVCKLVWV